MLEEYRKEIVMISQQKKKNQKNLKKTFKTFTPQHWHPLACHKQNYQFRIYCIQLCDGHIPYFIFSPSFYLVSNNRDLTMNANVVSVATAMWNEKENMKKLDKS